MQLCRLALVPVFVWSVLVNGACGGDETTGTTTTTTTATTMTTASEPGLTTTSEPGTTTSPTTGIAGDSSSGAASTGTTSGTTTGGVGTSTTSTASTSVGESTQAGTTGVGTTSAADTTGETGGGESSSTGGEPVVCPAPDPNKPLCQQCAQSKCCEQYDACFTSQKCTCIWNCLFNGGYAMGCAGQCQGQGMAGDGPNGQMFLCTDALCPNECNY